MTILGTRPDAVKLAPVVRELQADPCIETVVTLTAQHRELLDQVLSIFGITPTHDLDLMQPGQVLSDFAGRALQSLSALFAEQQPDMVIVQGDTTTAMVGALAAHYNGCALAHVEAGLRSGDLRNPFPEEANRRIISQLADLHFAPTKTGQGNLLGEGVAPDRIHVTGNTVIDALLYVADHATADRLPPALTGAPNDRKLILVTLHRRESFGAPLEGICEALGQLVDRNPTVEIFYPVHPNPNVRRTVYDRLGRRERVHLSEPLGYIEFVAVMRAAHFIITDSGGVQEEAPSLHKPVLVLRDATERPEVVELGAARLIGRKPADVLAAATELLTNPRAYEAMIGHNNPYGDGRAAKRIAYAVHEFLLGGRGRASPQVIPPSQGPL